MAPTARPMRVALTGGIATGKSFVARELAAARIPVVDADELAREAVVPGAPALDAIVERFGAEVLGAGGALDRRALGALVFNDASARRDLEAIVHPRVYAAIERFFDRLPPGTRWAVADIPLLYETGRAPAFDRVVVVACSPEEQLVRLVHRDGLTSEEARARIDAQWPISRKVQLADEVIRTDGTFDDTRAAVAALIERLDARARS